MDNKIVLIKGAGDIASGIAHRLKMAGFKLVMTELAEPTVIRRTVSFAQSVYDSQITVESLTAVRANDINHIEKLWEEDKIPIIVDKTGETVKSVQPFAVVDAILAKKNLGTDIKDAPVVIGCGPGFTAGENVHAVVETMRGHDLGRVYYRGAAIPNTGIPGDVAGYTEERVLRSPEKGRFKAKVKIGDQVQAGELLAWIICDDSREVEVLAPISGVVRGLLQEGLSVPQNFKIGDIDPRGNREHCFTISEKARAIGGGVLEALLHLREKAEQKEGN